MKRIMKIALLLVLVCSLSFTQEAWETHTCGLLHQSVFNTGALGVQWNSFRSAYSGDSLRTPFEWPGNSHFISDNRDYWYYNACGGGLTMLCDTGRTGNRADYLILDTVVSTTTRTVDMVGCLGLGSGGTYRDGTGIFYWPGSVTKTTNYPLNCDGSWNSSYDPNEAEEIITSSVSTPYGITITRVSRAWSYPGYDGFIIYDYKFENTGDYFKGIPNNTPDTLSEIAVSWIESFLPSYAYMNMQKGNFTSGASNQLARFDLKRYMQYVHSPDGRPHLTNYADWSANRTNGGGLMAPAAVGYMMLYFDYDHLMPIASSRFANAIHTALNEQNYVYDPNGKFKQPWVVATMQSGMSSLNILSHVQGSAGSRYNVWNPENPAVGDALIKQWLTPKDSSYWWGRGRPNNNYNFASPMFRSYVLGPYMLPPNESFHVVVAEVAGFGPGRKSDVQFRDYGGGNETTIGDQIDNNFHPVASWDSVITYTNAPTSISSTGGIGINYIPTYGIPDYIRDTNVISIRDVADRCIQLYSGNTSVIKYDTSQYEPWGNTSAPRYAPSPSAVAARTGGWNVGIKIPLPAPFISMDTNNTLSWSGTVDSLNDIIKPYVNSNLAYYEILRSTSKLGPWTRLDSIGRRDSRHWNASLAQYKFVDNTGTYGTDYYYCVVSVDTLGKKSGLTNMIKATHAYVETITNFQIYQNYPNPFNPKTQIKYLIAKRDKVSLIVYDLLGREVSKLVDEIKEVGSYSVTFDGARLSSGVYFYRLSSGSFVQTKKMMMIK